MSKPSTLVLINGVKPLRSNWKIRVKVLHVWKQNSSYGGATLECVLADESGVKIAAACKRNDIPRLEPDLQVGEWKSIDTFQVWGASGKYRPTTHQYKLIFSSETVITACDILSDYHFLSLANYDDLRKIDEKKNFFLKDVIGQVVDLNGVQTVQALGKDKKRVQFRLRDSSGDEIACCLWGKYAEQLEAQLEDSNNEMMICLIRFANISFFRGEVQVNNAFDASIVVINPNLEEAIELKDKILANDLPLALIEKREDKQIIQNQKEDWDEITIRSIYEILDATEVECCKIICSIESIETDWGWFYIGCNRHNRRVTKQAAKLALTGSAKIQTNQKPLFYCAICRSNISNHSPKYKLHLSVKDDSDSCTIMMLDSVAQAIIGSTATELWDGSYDEIEDPTILPQPIESLVGKSFCFGVKIGSDNVNNGSSTYKVAEVWSGNTIQKIETPSEPCSLMDTNSSTYSGGEVSMVDANKECSSEGFSTPFSKRKEEDADLLDMTSTSKKPCTQKVKVENTKANE